MISFLKFKGNLSCFDRKVYKVLKYIIYIKGDTNGNNK